MNRNNRVPDPDRRSEGRKQAISIRMGRGDLRQVKRLALRLGVRDSDVIRYAIKVMLARLAPLPNQGMTGRALVPVFIESGAELMRHFDLDAERLDAIINEGADEHWRVDAQDIQLLAMRGLQAGYPRFPADEASGSGRAPTLERGVAHGGTGGADRRYASLQRYLNEECLEATAPNGGDLRAVSG